MPAAFDRWIEEREMMARIRTIKPDFWTDEKLAECSIPARLLFVGALNFADDNGNMSRSAKKLKMQVFPADSLDCEPLIQELLSTGVWVEYAVNGEKFIHIKGFLKHQVINKPSKTNIPTPPLPAEPGRTPTPLPEPDGTEGKGREGKLTTLSGKPDGDQPEPPNETEQAKEAIAYLNEKTGKNYQPVDANIKPVRARIKETDLETVKAVIDRKVADWLGDEKMQEYLRPATLFNATKFASYAGDAGGNAIPAWER